MTDSKAGSAATVRAEILNEAIRIVTKDRAATHGAAEQGFAMIGAFWTAYLGVTVKAADVAAMMALLKIARISANPGHRDSWVDLAGYAACGGEVAS